MLALELISDLIAPLRTSDTGEEALTMMNIYHVKHLPIVNNRELLGMFSEEDILNNDLDEPVGSYELSLHKPYVHQNDHLFEVMATMAHNNLTIIPVIDDNMDFVGLITQSDLMKYFAKGFSFDEHGSLLVLETTKSNYSIHEISRIVEEENATILALFINSNHDSEKIEITLKINKQDLFRIIASFQRHDYGIKASFSQSEHNDKLKDRYDALMSYLNV